MTEKKSPIIKNIVDTFRILDVLNEEGEESIAYLENKLSIPKTTIFRILKTLESLKIIKQMPNSNYTLDYRLSAYAQVATKDNYLIELATPIMNQLCEIFSETVNLGIMYENQVLIIQSVEGDFYQLQASLVPVSPLYCSGMGKIFLSEFSISEIKKYFTDLPKRTVNTIVDSDVFIKSIEDIKKNGYSVDLEEYEYGLSCYAVPIHNKNGELICAMSISGPTTRLENKGIDTIVEELKEKGRDLEKNVKKIM